MLKKRKNKKLEESLQNIVCKYLDVQYPNIIYTSDMSGIKLNLGQATTAKKQRCKRYKIPDLLILQPNNKYHALILELKKSKDEIYLKDGSLSKKKHTQEQNKTLVKLEELGYKACFSCGFEESKKIINEYLKDYESIKRPT